ncbi:MAG: (cytosine-5)-methyltransferase 1 [Candidatus Eremiobacteraeota bacterium]|jgi:DNA (cytosine-5)-methyltransferase 1|nr:(cytosine-5)-methyltransferase 1 [Candidatus Eremiobacteraeota bacterium]
MVECVPPGGNWKDIPETVPSQRLEQIRTSFAAGKGSRSTYYGRLLPNEPSYTISTHFNRPGNGCFVHYDYAGGQHRMISHREAARFQTFPDSFVFRGPQGSVNRQIGNAVPPLLAYRLAMCLKGPGSFVDLFCGAGGSALGFVKAGWTPVVSNDIDKHSIETHKANFSTPAVLGDIREAHVLAEVIATARDGFRATNGPRVVVGGPPCQGFSTAGKRRTMDDERNHLFRQYAAILELLAPDYFVFENVTGILNMNNGLVFEMVKSTLTDAGYELNVATLRAEEHGVPQRRSRVIIIGTRHGVAVTPKWPSAVTRGVRAPSLFEAPPPATAVDAIGDLPALQHGEDGSAREYASEAITNLQQYARGEIDAATYIGDLAMMRALA